MRILLTGGGGMVGRNLLEHPGFAAHEVHAPGRAELDLRDAAATRACLARIRPDLVIHAAGRVGGIQANLRAPVAFLVENLDMGRNVVLAAAECGVPRFLNLGSSCMYPRDLDRPLREEQILTGELEPTNEGYALAKIAVARLCEYVTRERSGLRYVTAIPCNLYGRWDAFAPERSHLVPAAIRKVHEAKARGEREVVIWGDGSARREFMYAGDLADFIVRAGAAFDDLPLYLNVGLGRDATVDEYYAAAAEAVGYDGAFVHDPTKPVGMRRKVVDVTALGRFGWSAPTGLRDGIAATYRFFLERREDSR